MVLSQQGSRLETTQADFSGSGFSSSSRALGGHTRSLISPTAGSAGQMVHNSVVSGHV